MTNTRITPKCLVCQQPTKRNLLCNNCNTALKRLGNSVETLQCAINYLQGKGIKRCSECQLSKPATDFYKQRRNEDKLRSECKTCTRLKSHKTGFANVTHGRSGSIEYSSYRSAKQRCNNPNDISFSFYGGRGIEFKFETFEDFFTEVGKRPSLEYSLDRINSNGHYETGNVRWATKKEQIKNRRNMPSLIEIEYKGKKMSLKEIAKMTNHHYSSIWERYLKGWCVDCLLSSQKPAKACRH